MGGGGDGSMTIQLAGQHFTCQCRMLCSWKLRLTLALPCLCAPPGGITRVSEALEVIDKSARLDAATAAAAARATSGSAASDGQSAGEDEGISFA